MKYFFVLIAFSTLFSVLPAQSPNLWQPVAGAIPSGEQRIHPEVYQLRQIDFPQLKDLLHQAPPEQTPKGLTVSLPNPEGEMEAFQVWKVPVLHPSDEADYPDIRTFVAHGLDDPYAYARLDFTPHGFHAMVLTVGGSWWIDPLLVGNQELYQIYHKKHLKPRPGEDYSCHSESTPLAEDPALHLPKTLQPIGTQLLTYELALSCVGEYGAYHGGTKPLILGAMVTTMNRSSGVFERDMTIRMVLIPNNDTLIFGDPTTDPYGCCNLGQQIGRSIQVIDSIVGPNAYDFTHVFTTYGGGLASFGTCPADQNGAATGLTNPVGDPFDVDYVSHEFGHQFNAAHTFNYCPGPGGVPHEPGSGSTIMAYAGLCGTANMQTFSVDAFSVGTYEQSVNYTRLAFGNTCATITPTGNTPPTVTVPSGGFYIPKSTPFELTASGNDLDGDSLTFSWEQFDLGPNTHPDTLVGNCPLFRVLWPTPDSTRIFPQIDDIVTGASTIGERVADYGRDMTFRCVVRDNQGGASYEEMKFFVTDTAGPFRVLYPSVAAIGWTAGDIETITWDVANSDISPVNCSAVDIYLSSDGGYTYPILLATNRPNTGATPITVPSLVGSQFRIKVKGRGNHFFDISDNNFSISPPSQPDFSLSTLTPSQTACGLDTAIYSVVVDSLGAFSNPVTFLLNGVPSGASHSLSVNPATPPTTLTVKVWNNTAPTGNYSLQLQGSATSGTKVLPLTLELRPANLPPVSLVAPINGATNQPLTTSLNWNLVPFAPQYHVQLAVDPTFSFPLIDTLVQNLNSLTPSTPLQNNQIYYWRVRADSGACPGGNWSSIYSFETPLINCQTYTSTDVPVSIAVPVVDTVYSTLNVPNSISIADVDVSELKGDHTWVGDLWITLTSPQGTPVQLFRSICGNQDDFDLKFDDSAAPGAIPCPPTTGGTYLPDDPLSAFNGQNAQGIWTLEIIDQVGQDGGTLTDWSLYICGPPLNTTPPSFSTLPLLLDQGDNAPFSTIQMNLACFNPAATAYYVITSLPANGQLFLNGVPVVVGDIVTQDNVDLGQFTYQHDNSATTSDQFQFTAHCSTGGYLGGLNQSIVITPVVGVDPAFALAWQLFPNPTRDRFQVECALATGRDMEVRVYNGWGQMVAWRSGNGPRLALNGTELASGLYSVELWVEGKRQGSRKLVLER